MPCHAWGTARDVVKLRFVTRIKVSFLWASDLVYNIAGEEDMQNTKRLWKQIDC